tara:strand:+ start:313 stop:492 length:180 start_codon:yes stop_codon:yes gene_type:complete
MKLINDNEHKLNLEASNFEMSMLLEEIQNSLKKGLRRRYDNDREKLIKKIQKTLDRATF